MHNGSDGDNGDNDGECSGEALSVILVTTYNSHILNSIDSDVIDSASDSERSWQL